MEGKNDEKNKDKNAEEKLLPTNPKKPPTLFIPTSIPTILRSIEIVIVDLDSRIVGFFNLEYYDRTIGLVTIIDKYELYRDIYVFINRLYNVVNIMPYTYTIVKNVIP